MKIKTSAYIFATEMKKQFSILSKHTCNSKRCKDAMA